MITVKERTDFDETQIDEFTIYDLYSEALQNEKSPDSSSKASAGNPVTFLSQYQVITYSVTDLTEFVNLCVKKNYS